MNVEKIDGYDDDTAPVLGHVLAAFNDAYEGIGKVYTARAAAKDNPTWNDAQQIIKTQDMADAVFARVAKAMDSSRTRLEQGIAHLEKELTQPVESRASHPVSIEVRSYIRNLPSAERMGFIKRAIDAGDHETAQAALGAANDAVRSSALLRCPASRIHVPGQEGDDSVTEEDWALYRKRQLEIHEERGFERQLRADANLLAGIKFAKDLRKLGRK